VGDWKATTLEAAGTAAALELDFVTVFTRRVAFARRRCMSSNAMIKTRIAAPMATGIGFNWANSSQ